MEKPLLTSLSTLDTSLNTLLDSLTSNTPSLPAAHALLSADDTLQANVATLQRHQAKHARIVSLRSQIDSLNTLITEKLTGLADLRAEILAQDITPVAEEGQKGQVDAGELLGFAQRISRTTVPPSYRPKAKQIKEEKKVEEVAAANGVSAAVGDEVGIEKAGDEKKDEEKPPEIIDMGGWTPWPSDEIIRQGALGQIQAMVENGEDPAAATAKKEQDQTMEGVQKEESRIEEGAKEEIGVEEVRREVPKAPFERPRVFGGLDLYDPDEDMQQ